MRRSAPVTCFAGPAERAAFWGDTLVPSTRAEERAYLARTVELARRCGRDGDLLASSDSDLQVQVWEFAGNKTRHVLKGPAADIRSLAFSRDGKQFIAWSATEARAWDVPEAPFPSGGAWREWLRRRCCSCAAPPRKWDCCPTAAR